MSGLPLFPAPEELLDRSTWIAGRPGLDAAVRDWLATYPAERERRERRAIALARPSLHRDGLVRLAEVGGLALGAAGRWVANDVPGALVRALVMGERPGGREAAVARAQELVRAGGPVYVKLGQFIATMGGILPDDVVDAFSWCRDEVRPLRPGVALEVIERQLGRPLDEVFDQLDERPLAAASIAQVHRATLKDGTEVVVKVRRPRLKRRFYADIRALALVAAVAEGQSDAARALNVSGIVELFARQVLQELDLRLEALNMVEVGLAVEDTRMDHVRVPRPVPELVRERVLVMDHLSGVRYTDAPGILAAGVDPTRLLRLGVQSVLETTLVYGIFHGDLHAGNVLVDVDGSFGLVDFGIVGRLDPGERASLVRFMVGVGSGDINAQLLALRELGVLPPDADVRRLAETLEQFRPERDLTTVSREELVEGVGRALRLLVANGFRLPQSLVLFFKNLVYLSGFAASIAPDVDLLAQIDPIFGYFRGRYGDQVALFTDQL